MKTYIKQLIDSKGNNLIPVSSTSSCYNSNGQTADELLAGLRNDLDSNISELSNSLTELEENITTQISADIEDLKNRSVKLSESFTWAELQQLKNSKKLNPGQKYIVTDFKTTSSTPGTTTTGKGIKLILTATDKNSLDENGLGIISGNGSGGGNSQDISSGTVTVKKLILGDDQNEDDPGEWMIDEGCDAAYFFHDMYELGGTTYYRWMKRRTNGYPLGITQGGGPIFILTTTDTFDFTSISHYEPDFCIMIDQETGNVDDDYNSDKSIMGEEEVELPLMLFENEFADDYPKVIDPGECWVYYDIINLGGTDYYMWGKYDNAYYRPDNDQGPFLLTDTLDLTFSDTDSYEPVAIVTIEGDNYDPDEPNAKQVLILDTNYKFALSGSGGGSSVELVEVKYCLDNDTARFSWASENITVETLEIYTDDDLWFTNSRTANIDGTTYYIWENDDFVDVDNNNSPCYLLSTSLDLENGDLLDCIHQDLDPETISPDYSEITNTRAGTKTVNPDTGVIYWMRDKNNNEAPYDFKNILFNGHYTFDLGGSDFSGSCYNNTIQPVYENGKQVLNRVTFQNTNDSDACNNNFVDYGTRDINYGPGTSDLDTRLILGEY